MHIRRPTAALFVALALLGGGSTMTACSSSGQNQNDGTSDSGSNTSGSNPSGTDQGNVPDNSNQQPGSTDSEDPAH
jgi:hypothetical protein